MLTGKNFTQAGLLTPLGFATHPTTPVSRAHAPSYQLFLTTVHSQTLAGPCGCMLQRIVMNGSPHVPAPSFNLIIGNVFAYERTRSFLHPAIANCSCSQYWMPVPLGGRAVHPRAPRPTWLTGLGDSEMCHGMGTSPRFLRCRWSFGRAHPKAGGRFH